ncbi:hypothetical protein H9P43_001588 [Blastocladiella emersonii ATCC 22665]|nr:hypothetical protein H9P43_001588 [Blastocladiella emersonii ATCC 22665]
MEGLGDELLEGIPDGIDGLHAHALAEADDDMDVELDGEFVDDDGSEWVSDSDDDDSNPAVDAPDAAGDSDGWEDAESDDDDAGVPADFNQPGHAPPAWDMDDPDHEFDGLDVTECVDQALALHAPGFHDIPAPVQQGITTHLTRRLFLESDAPAGPSEVPLAQRAQIAFMQYTSGRPTALLDLLREQFESTGLDLYGGRAHLMQFGVRAIQEESRLMSTLDFTRGGSDAEDAASETLSSTGWSDEDSDVSAEWEDDEADIDLDDAGAADGDAAHTGVNGHPLTPDLERAEYSTEDWDALTSASYYDSIRALHSTNLVTRDPRWPVQFAVRSDLSHFQCANYLALGEALPLWNGHLLQRPITLKNNFVITHSTPHWWTPDRVAGAAKERLVVSLDMAPITLAARNGYIVTGGDAGDLRFFCTQGAQPAPPPTASPTWGEAPLTEAELVAIMFKDDMYNSAQIIAGVVPGTYFAVIARNRGRVDVYRLPAHADGGAAVRPHGSPGSTIRPVFSLSGFRGCVNDAKVSPDLAHIACIGDGGKPWLVALEWSAAGDPRPTHRPIELDPTGDAGLQAFSATARIAGVNGDAAPNPRETPEQRARAFLGTVTSQYLTWSACSRRFAYSCDTQPCAFVWELADDGSADAGWGGNHDDDADHHETAAAPAAEDHAQDDGDDTDFVDAAATPARLLRVVATGQPTYAVHFNLRHASLLAVSNRHGFVQIIDVDAPAAHDVLPVTLARRSCAITGMQWSFDGQYLYAATRRRVLVFQVNRPRSLVETAVVRAVLRPPPGAPAVDWAAELSAEALDRVAGVFLDFDASLRH